jgi:hypothetical protein
MSTAPTPPRIPLRWLLLVGLPALGVLLWWKLPPRTDDPFRGQPGPTWISTNTSARLGIGDDPRWVDPRYDDSGWPEVDLNELPPSDGIYWLRIHMTIAPHDTPEFARLANSATGIRRAVGERIRRFGVNALAVESPSAQELFWEGRPIGRAGVPGATRAAEEPGVHRSFFPLPTGLTGPGDYLLAVRLSQQRALHWSKYSRYYVWAGRFDDMVTRVWIYTLGGMGLMGIGLVGAAFCFVAWWLVERRAGFLAFAGCCFGFAVLGSLPVAREIGWVDYPGYQALQFASGALNLVVGVLLLLSAVQFLELPRRGLWLLLAVPPLVLTPFFHVYFFLRGIWPMHWYLAATLLVALAGWSLRRRGAGWVAAAVAVPWALELTGYMQLARNFGDFEHGALVLLFGVGLFRSIGFSLRSEQLRTRQSQLSSARLETELLMRNIQPHFLLNSLGSIAQFVEENPAIASRMIDALGDEFRLVSKLSRHQLVTLGEEIDLCEAHLRVMSLRREASYRLEVDVPDRAAPIPPALLHTLVENAITHGGPSHAGERVLRLAETRTADGSRVIELQSPMTAHTGARAATRDRPDGTGLRYVKARLEESFPGRWTFVAAPVGDSWRVCIVLAPARAFSEVI